jgi:hypothetical protein
MSRDISFLFDELITCGAVLSAFELAEALKKQGCNIKIVSRFRNKELEDYFGIISQKRWDGNSISVTFTPKLAGEWAYVRTKDERWLTHKSKKIAVSKWIADWIGTDTVIGNGTHERFYNMGLERDIEILICGNYEANKNIDATIEEARTRAKGIIGWMGRTTKEIPGVLRLDNPPLVEIPVIYNRAKTFLSMSKSEGWGRPVAEAKACGCEVINLNGGNRDVEVIPWSEIANQFIKIIC